MRRSLLFVLFVLCSTSWAAQPPRFSYQAKLNDSAGIPLAGVHTLFFRLFQGGTANGANSGTEVFAEQATLSIAEGIANHSVGTGTNQTLGPLTAGMLRGSGDLFLQVAVDSPGNVILPRTRLDSVPFAVVSADGDPRVAVSGPAPVVLSQPGSYFLTENIIGVWGQNGIEITTSGVVLDLSGYSVIGVPGSVNGIQLLVGVLNTRIHNGTISSWGNRGISGTLSLGTHVHHVHATRNELVGIRVGEGSIIEDCVAAENNARGGGGGIFVDRESIVSNCIAKDNIAGLDGDATGIAGGSRCLVTGCLSTNNRGKGSGGNGTGIRVGAQSRVLNNSCTSNVGGIGTTTVFGIGINAGAGSLVSGNLCQFNSGSPTAANSSGVGIMTAAGCYVHSNTCSDNDGQGTGSSSGIQVAGRCRVENNHCTNHSGTTSNNFGIRVSGSNATGCTIVKNSTANNTNAGIRLDNTSGSNYHAENMLSESLAVTQASAGNLAGTGDRSNILFP